MEMVNSIFLRKENGDRFIFTAGIIFTADSDRAGRLKSSLPGGTRGLGANSIVH